MDGRTCGAGYDERIDASVHAVLRVAPTAFLTGVRNGAPPTRTRGRKVLMRMTSYDPPFGSRNRP